MSDTWMSVAEAAAGLKCHTRTIERRIAGGKLQTRRNEQGILQVLIAAPDGSFAPDNRSDMSDSPDSSSFDQEQAFETVRELADNQVSLVAGSASAIVRLAQEESNRAREEVLLVRQDARRSRNYAVAAWMVVAAMGVGVVLAVGWTADKIARADERVRQLNDLAAKVETESQKLIDDRNAAWQELEFARQASEKANIEKAESAGRLAAYVEQHKIQLLSDKRPATSEEILEHFSAVE
jgi:hypothetical protein